MAVAQTNPETFFSHCTTSLRLDNSATTTKWEWMDGGVGVRMGVVMGRIPPAALCTRAGKVCTRGAHLVEYLPGSIAVENREQVIVNTSIFTCNTLVLH